MKQKRNNRINQIGTYLIDSIKTTWGTYDKNKFKNVRITFNQNGTYLVNMKVPFLIDATGSWIEADGGFEEYGKITYNNSTYKSPAYGGIDGLCYYVSVEWTEPQKNMPSLELLVLKKQGNNYKLYEDNPSWVTEFIISNLL